MTELKPASTSRLNEVTTADLARAVDRLGRRLSRERRARIHAEELLEAKSAELFDASERLKAESVRAHALASAIETATDGLAITDADGVFTYMNTAHAEMFDYLDSELIGESWWILYTPAMAEFISRTAMPVLAAKGSWRGEVEGVSKSGETISQEVVLTARGDGGLICSTRDIGDRLRREREGRELEARLLKAEREAALFTVGNAVAHDFNNLIAAISGYALLLQGDLSEDSEAFQRAGHILEAANQASAVVRSLEVERINNVQSLDELDLVKLLRTGLAISDAIRPRGIKLDIDLPDIAVVSCNEVLLTRALINIAKNAFDAMVDEGAFAVRLGKTRTHTFQSQSHIHSIGDLNCQFTYVLELVDNGPGISSDKLEQVFNPFTTTKGALRGSGLGLLSLKALADSRSVVVEVETCPGEGTCFRLLFADTSVKPCGDGEAQSRPAPAVGRTRVLVVDDNVSVGQMLAETLERQGMISVWQGNPNRALQMIVESPGSIDVVLTDLTMPQLSGEELARRIRDVRNDLPVILYSGQGRYVPSDPIYADILTKPISPERLGTAIASAVNRDLSC